MDRPEFPTGGRKELQGPRPAPLKVSKDSYKIKKPPLHHPSQPHLHHQQPPAANRQPVVIYTVSPKVIHTTVNDFMNLVQRLTGPSPRAAANAGDVSPAARLASVEKISPRGRQQQQQQQSHGGADELMEIIEGATRFGTGQIPGILSPEPANLLPVSLPGLFSPAPDPFLYGNNMYIPSPSFLLSSPIISPSFSPSYDLFNSFFES